MLYALLISFLGLSPAYGASTDTPQTIEPSGSSVTREIPQKVISFKAQDTVKDIEPKKEETEARYNIPQAPKKKHQEPKKTVKKAKPHPRNIPLTSMQVRDNQEEPEHPTFLNKGGLGSTSKK